jgi:hypothetical protein
MQGLAAREAAQPTTPQIQETSTARPAAESSMPTPQRPAVSAGQPGWLVDEKTGCKVWSVRPTTESVSWSGSCGNGLAQGRGILQWLNKDRLVDRYEGELWYGKRNGQGKITLANGVQYEGSWRDGVQNGQGKLTLANGDRYEGEFQNGIQSGQVREIFANGNRYEGEARDGIRNGQGIMTFTNGDRYEGHWHDGLPSGYGELVRKDVHIGGEWVLGCFHDLHHEIAIGRTRKACGFD